MKGTYDTHVTEYCILRTMKYRYVTSARANITKYVMTLYSWIRIRSYEITIGSILKRGPKMSWISPKLVKFIAIQAQAKKCPT